MKYVPFLVQLPEYTQAEEDTLAASLTGTVANVLPIVYNSTLEKERSWSGTIFINSPQVSPTIIPLVSATESGLAPETGTPSGKFLKDDLTWTSILLPSNNLSDVASALTSRANLGLAIGTDVQAFDADLNAIAGLTATTDNFIVSVSSTWASRTPTQVKTTLALNNVTNESKATMFTAPVFTGAAVLGTPASGNLENCTFPTLNQNSTGSSASLSVSGQTGLLTFTGLASTNRVKTVRDAADTILELGGSYTPTGTWTSMTLVTPNIGVATATTVNKVTITAPASSATLTILNGKTLTVNKSITLEGTDSTTITLPTTSATIARTDALQTFTGVQTFSSAPVFSVGIPKTEIPNGIRTSNSAEQSQVVVSGTNYYITNSGLTMPAAAKAGMVVGTKFVWRLAMTKTAAGTGIFQISIYRGTNGSTSDTQDVLQTLGTQTAVVDSMVVDVTLYVTTTGASGAYFWTITPVNKAITATGFGIATGTTGYFSGTVSGVAMNTASLIFGLGFKSTTGTPTIRVVSVEAQAYNMC